MARDLRRVRILCEDRRTERFVRQLCKRYGVRVDAVMTAPAGKGAASAWVRHNYATQVQKRRSKNFQANLGLLVVIDGDDVGVEARLHELASELDAAVVERREDGESIAVFVPTWSIETWLASLSGAEDVGETTALKTEARFRPLWNDGAAEVTTIKTAVAAWNGSVATLPSLLAAYTEATKIGLCSRSTASPTSTRP